jgi:NAD(P)-dependent dehydrogenase (short-subunit alcohol dehydrogenase family)
MSYPKINIKEAVVVVTGAGRGIGLETAKLFAARGATVCIGDLDGAVALDAARAIGAAAHGYQVDVASKESFAEFVDAVLFEHGRIDVLVNNAGVMPLGPFLDEDDAISRTTLNVNVWGPINGMRLVLPHMIERGSGHVVNVASMAGKLAIPGMAVYNASKFAAVGLSAAVREEYAGTGVSVTAILPSAVRTRLSSGVDMPAALPLVEPEDVARAVVASVSSRAAEVSVPGYLAPLWELADATIPERVIRLGLRVAGARSALTGIRPDRREYEDTIRQQAGRT